MAIYIGLYTPLLLLSEKLVQQPHNLSVKMPSLAKPYIVLCSKILTKIDLSSSILIFPHFVEIIDVLANSCFMGI